MAEKIKKILIISSDENLQKVLDFCFDGWGYEVLLRDAPFDDIKAIKKISPDAIVVDVYSATKTNLSLCRLLKEDLITAFIPVITLINKRQLRQELLLLKQGVDDYLIKPPDPLDLRVRIEMAIKRAQYSYYTTPLTGLPGSRMIEETLAERIGRQESFTFGYIDIDNFKYFNDVYGYVRGDRIIMQTAYILYTTIRRFGGRDDFIGHIGGDDFVFITGIDKAQSVCENFICMFDTLTPFHYCAEDRQQGFVLAKDRNRKLRRASLVSVSVALVHKRSPREFTSLVEINEKLAEIKRYLKEIPGSKFMADRRDQAQAAAVDPSIYHKKEAIMQAYRPLGQILLEQKVVSDTQLDDALKMHWRKDIPLGETLKDLGLLKESQLQEALSLQRQKLKNLVPR